MQDRIDAICELLLGAAYADSVFRDSEKDAIVQLLTKLLDDELPEQLRDRIESFDPETFELALPAGQFADDPEPDRFKLLELIAAVHAADDEFDLAEDEYLHQVADVLGVTEGLASLTLDFEVEELKEDLETLRSGPPPLPGERDTPPPLPG